MLSSLGFRQLHAGDNYTLTFNLVDHNDDPIDLTSATVWFTVKRKSTDEDSSALLFLITTGTSPGVVIQTPATDGIVCVYFRPADTGLLEGLWQYDLQIKTAALGVVTVLYGAIEFLKNITRAY
jgi:hypothetical protein